MKRFLPIFATLFGLSFFFPKASKAQYTPLNDVPIPQIHFPCDKQTQPEFASLRPYQAAACGDADKALYCSNDLIFLETFNSFPECGGQAPAGEGKFICNTNKFIPNHNLIVDLANSDLPILGNTELTKDSINSTDKISDAGKMNEYASWYLNGTLNRAEYGQIDPTQIADYSGPIQKVMPQVILEADRIGTIASASAMTTYIPENDNGGTAAPQATTEPQNHNQIVVCYKKQAQLIPPIITNFFGLGAVGLGKALPGDCYDGAGHMTDGLSILRLESWDKSSPTVDVAGIASWLLKIFPPNIVSILTSSTAILDRWPYKFPPLPWSDKNGQPFSSPDAYQKAYNEWRGQLCAYISFPILGTKLFCGGIPGVTNNDFADLFPFIPLGNTVDKHGSETAYIAEIQPLGETQIADPSYDVPKNAPLWFSHTEEVMNMSKFLNSSYTPLDCTVTNGKQTCQPLASVAEPKTTEANVCNVVNVRTNSGDNLFPGQTHGVVVPNVHYTITQVPCEKKIVIQTIGKPPNEKTVRRTVITCDAEINITIPTITKSPSLDPIFQSTVAYSGSTFRKIYPKVETGAPVNCIADIPGSTGVDYTGTDNVPAGGNSSFKYKNPALGSNNASELYFPHLGSVYDYFLKGIQTALRPQGFGAPTPISGKYCSPTVPTQCNANVPDSAVSSKFLGAFKTNFILVADRWTLDCPGPQYNLAAQCYNYVVSEAQKAGVNPAFALSIWLHESDASNYCHGGLSTQDFGQNVASEYQNIVAQLTGFLAMAKQKLCNGVPGFPEPMAGWLSRYKSSSGSCNPADSDAMSYYPEIRDTSWGVLTNCVKGTKFGITWPTDMSCP
jgi:hypothetical protein